VSDIEHFMEFFDGYHADLTLELALRCSLIAGNYFWRPINEAESNMAKAIAKALNEHLAKIAKVDISDIVLKSDVPISDIVLTVCHCLANFYAAEGASARAQVRRLVEDHRVLEASITYGRDYVSYQLRG